MDGSPSTVSLSLVYPWDELRTGGNLAMTDTQEAGQCLSRENVFRETAQRPAARVHQGSWEPSLREPET